MFSVVIPVFNGRRTLERTVFSVLRQQGPKLELIVVDDGSTDGSLDVLDSIYDPRLRTIRQANAGAGAARNAGIAAAEHEWVALLDADDIWLDGHLAELDAIRRTYPAAGLIGTVDARAPPGAARVFIPRRASRIRTVRYLAAVGRGEALFGASSAAVRKEAWRKAGGFSTSREGPDSEFWARLSLSEPVAVSSRVTAIYVRMVRSDSDQARARRFGKPPQGLADLSHSVRMLMDRYAGADSALRLDIDRYATRYLDYRLREAVVDGDLSSLRALRPLYPSRRPAGHRLVLAAARLPDRFARLASRLGVSAISLPGRVRRMFEPGEWVALDSAHQSSNSSSRVEAKEKGPPARMSGGPS
jgi:glycosyltransferase involved in cell wall biosynthesis